MESRVKNRAPLTEQEVFDFLNEEVEKQAKHWGPDYIYTKWARESRDEKLAKFKAGEVVPVYKESYVDKYGNGCGEYEDVLYSDGTVTTCCYGYSD